VYKFYSDGSPIDDCGSKVIGGSTIVVETPSEIDPLRALCAECENLASFHNWLSNYARWLEWFDVYRDEYQHRLRGSYDNQLTVHPGNLSDIERLRGALRIAQEIWASAPETDVDNLRLSASVISGETDLEYKADQPALLLYQGSLFAEFIPFVPHLGFVLRVGKFVISLALKTGAAAPVKAEQMVEELRARVKITSKNYPELARLDKLEPGDLANKKGIIILLHGLASTDVCTFDGFLDAWTQPQRVSRGVFDDAFRWTVRDFLYVGWPHDTLTSIATNAGTLFELIHAKIGEDGPPIVFVCHSRGGLLARKVAVIMQKQGGKWPDKVKLCVTFGTPHLGADLATNPYRFMGAYASVMSGDKKLLSIYRLLSYYAQEKKFEGIDDLRPAEAQGSEFIRKLREEEREAGKPDPRKLQILPVGGVYRGSHSRLMGLVTGMLGTTDHDLVVRKKSTVPELFTGGETVACSHFEYFTEQQTKAEHFPRVIEAIKKALEFDKVQEQWLDVATNKPPTADKPVGTLKTFSFPPKNAPGHSGEE
jgi:hypothetical protein